MDVEIRTRYDEASGMCWVSVGIPDFLINSPKEWLASKFRDDVRILAKIHALSSLAIWMEQQHRADSDESLPPPAQEHEL